jgi:hypothetical protein
LKEGIPVYFVAGSLLEKAMLASCPAVAMPKEIGLYELLDPMT